MSMNDFLVDEIYKNTQRLRSKNQVEEKLLHQIVEGHKGYREKLKYNLKLIYFRKNKLVIFFKLNKTKQKVKLYQKLRKHVK